MRGFRGLAGFTQIGAGKFQHSGAFGPLGSGGLVRGSLAGDFQNINQSCSLSSSGSSAERRDSSSVGSGFDGPGKMFGSDEYIGQSLTRE